MTYPRPTGRTFVGECLLRQQFTKRSLTSSLFAWFRGAFIGSSKGKDTLTNLWDPHAQAFSELGDRAAPGSALAADQRPQPTDAIQHQITVVKGHDALVAEHDHVSQSRRTGGAGHVPQAVALRNGQCTLGIDVPGRHEGDDRHAKVILQNLLGAANVELLDRQRHPLPEFAMIPAVAAQPAWPEHVSLQHTVRQAV